MIELPRRRMKKKVDISPKVCNDNRACFARKRAYDGVGPLICCVLDEAYPVPGTCPFRKPEREVTKGKYYPYNERLLDHNARKKFDKEEEIAYAEN